MSYTVGGLTPGVTCSFKVQAINGGGSSALSATAQTTMWLGPQLTMTPATSSTQSGDQATWTVALANLNDRPTPVSTAVHSSWWGYSPTNCKEPPGRSWSRYRPD